MTLLGLVGLLLLTGRREAAPERRVADIATVAARVEQVRGLRFERRPEPVTVTAADARREGLAELDRSYPEARRRADEQVLELLGLVPAGTDLREVSASIYEGEVAGYYDPRTERLRLVEGSSGGSSLMEETVLAHELVHALEDQRFELRDDLVGSDDAELAYTALAEGTATAVMTEYAARHFSAEEALGGALSAAFAGGGGQASLPPFVQAQLLFPYEAGQRFVTDLYRRAGGRWTLVDLALETRPPSTTEQVLHPGDYVQAEPALAVQVGPRERSGGWERAAAGVLGEWGTGQLLGSADAARGWGGDRYELWRGPGAAPVLAAAWRWDDVRGLRRFERRLRDRVRRRAGPGVARVSRAGASVRLTVGEPSALDAFAASTGGGGSGS